MIDTPFGKAHFLGDGLISTSGRVILTNWPTGWLVYSLGFHRYWMQQSEVTK